MNVEVSDIIAITKKVISEKRHDGHFCGRKTANAFFEDYGKLECATNPEAFITILGEMFDRIYLCGADVALDVVNRVNNECRKKESIE